MFKNMGVLMGVFQRLLGKTRCPACGTVAVHRRGSRHEDPSKFMLLCIECGSNFDNGDAYDWETIAKKIGEDQAIAEYKKL